MPELKTRDSLLLIPGDLVSELLAQDPLVEAMAGIEQHVHRDAVVETNVDGADRPYLVVVGDRGNRTFFRFQNLDRDVGAVRQQRAAPAPRPERANWRQRQERRAD